MDRPQNYAFSANWSNGIALIGPISPNLNFSQWVCCWGLCLLGMISIAMYALIRGKDPQGQMGFMYEMFTKYAIDPRFVSNFERYQKDVS